MAVNMTAINKDLSLWTPAADGKIRGFDKSGSTPLDVRAFPGAEGLAALTRGAAGHVGAKTVAFVDNTNDSGAGSLRAAVEGAGNEGTFIIFRTNGNINLSTVLETTSDNLTFAFQTSPSGVAVVGAPLRLQDTSDVIIRHGRFRCGSHQPISETDQESLSVWNVNNVMVANTSATWGADETVGCTSFGGVAFTNVTFMDCIIGEGLTDPAPEANHGYGILMNGTYASGNTIDFGRVLFTNCNGRLPQWSGDTTSNAVNCVVYNFDGSQSSMLDMQGAPGPKVNSLSCMTKAGIDSNGSIRYDTSTAAEYIALGTGAQNVVAITPYEAFYQRRSFGTDRLLDADSEWSIVNGFSGAYLPTATFEAASPFSLPGGLPIPEIVVSESNYETVRDQVVAGVGATVPVRDSADTNIVNDYTNGTGTLVPDVTYPDDFPTYGTDSYPTDTDGDGIPDSYWTYRGISSQTWDDVAPSGYLWIEEFINDLADGNYSYA
jgi:hypothetical protein